MSDLFDLGFDQFGTKPPLFQELGLENIQPKAKNTFTDGVAPEKLLSGEAGANIQWVDGYIRSRLFVSGSSGWEISADGDAEFNSGIFRASLEIGLSTDPNIRLSSDVGFEMRDTNANLRFGIALNDTPTWGDEGDIYIGDYANNKGIFWDQSAATFYVRGQLNASDIVAGTLSADRIAAGSLESTKLGTTVISGGKIVTGLLTADNIQAGTLTGRTVKANNGSGSDIWISNTGLIEYRYGGDQKAYMWANTSGSLVIGANDSMHLRYNDNGGSDSFAIVEDGGVAMQIDSGKNVIIPSGDLAVQSGQIWADDYNFNDYAEFFEATKEFSKEKIPFGVTVVLEGNKIRPAVEGEEPVGVVSATAGITLGIGRRWHKKYKQNDLGEYEYEEVTEWKIRDEKTKETLIGILEDGQDAPKGARFKKLVRRKLNPDFDPSKKYIPRKDRPEWNPVGLLGQVRVLKGQPVSKRWIKLREVSDKVDEYLIR
jgi:hypothetical protein